MRARSRYYKKLLLLVGGLTGVLAMGLLFRQLLSPWLVAGSSVLLLGLTWLVLGLERARFREKDVVLIVVSVACLVWWMVQFLLGFVFGLVVMLRSSDNVYASVLPMVILIVSSEMMRANLIRKSGGNKLAIVGATILVTLLGAMMIVATADFSQNLDVARFVLILLVPWIFNSMLLSFLAYKAGWQPAVAYRMLVFLPILLMPVVTYFDDFMQGVVNLVLPVIVYFVIYKLTLEREQPRGYERPNRILKAAYFGGFGVLIVLTLMLFSGLFKYYPLSVATGSMAPNINVGDFVIVRRIGPEEAGLLGEGEVLVFDKGGRVVVHRIVGIELGAEGERLFTTKGDANNAPDTWRVREGEIIGVAGLKVPLVGYPTLWVHGQLTGRQE
ncbi:signal peptidase I [Candidatus Saccharibacteria bacterium]|nr:signal peptidase I [Candidatus Saccharibacteria bacterium]